MGQENVMHHGRHGRDGQPPIARRRPSRLAQKLGGQIGLRLDGFEAPTMPQFGRLHRFTGCNRYRLTKQVHGCRERAAHSGGLQQELPTGQEFLG